MQMIVDDGQPHLWVPAPKSGEGRRHERAQYCREAAEAQPATTSPTDLGNLLFSGFQPSEDAPCVPCQRSTGFGEFDRSAAAPHHRKPDLALQCGDVLTDR